VACVQPKALTVASMRGRDDIKVSSMSHNKRTLAVLRLSARRLITWSTTAAPSSRAKWRVVDAATRSDHTPLPATTR
jgi:hypothetical protein